MALANNWKILSASQNLKAKRNFIMYLHKNRKYVIDNRRNFSCKGPEQKTSDKQRPQSCPNKSCNKKEKKKSFWGGLFGSGQKEKAKPLPPFETCRMRKDECKPDPDLSIFGGQAYKTCGTAYVIQKELLPEKECVRNPEDKIIKKMEAAFEHKTQGDDPIPTYTSAEQRLIDLHDKRLHPFYRRYMTITKRPKIDMSNVPKYKSQTGPIDPNDIPKEIKYNKALLEQKNLFAEYKRVEPPRHLLSRVIEMRKNEKPTLEKKPVQLDVKKQSNPKAVYDTLYQKQDDY